VESAIPGYMVKKKQPAKAEQYLQHRKRNTPRFDNHAIFFVLG